MLSLLLDEQMSPVIVDQVIAKDGTVRIASVHKWHAGEFLHTADDIILEAAYREQTTLVTFDQSTIRPVLKDWGEQGRSHGGVIFIDDKSIAQNNYGGLVTALLKIWRQTCADDFTDVVLFLQKARQEP